MSARSFFTVSDIIELDEFEIEIDELVVIEDAKSLNFERVCEELRDLLKLGYSTYHANSSYYETYLRNIVHTLKGAMLEPYIPGDEGMQPSALTNARYVINATTPDLSEPADLYAYLAERIGIIKAPGNVIVAETRLADHSSTLLEDSDFCITKARDVRAIDENSDRTLRVVGSCSWQGNNGPLKTDRGDCIDFVGIEYVPAVVDLSGGMTEFDVAAYIKQLRKLRVDDSVIIAWNHNGKQQPAKVVHSGKGLIRLATTGKDQVVDVCVTDPSANPCFVYEKDYEGARYDKSKLEKESWRFLYPAKSESDAIMVESIVLPTVHESIDAIPSHRVTDVFKAWHISGRPCGRLAAEGLRKRVMLDVKHALTTPTSSEETRRRGRTLRFKLTPGVDFLQFGKQARVLSKYFDLYTRFDTFSDSDVARFYHIHHKKHLFSAYCLDLYRRSLRTVTLPKVNGQDEESIEDSQVHWHPDLGEPDLIVNSLRDMYTIQGPVENMRVVVHAPGQPPELYAYRSPSWQAEKRMTPPRGFVFLPGAKHATNLEMMYKRSTLKATIQSASALRAFKARMPKFKTDMTEVISMHTNLQDAHRMRMFPLHAGVQPDAPEGSDVLGDGEVAQDDFMNNAEGFGEQTRMVVEDDIQIDDVPELDMEAPYVQLVLSLVQVFDIDVKADEIRMLVYNAHRTQNFAALQASLKTKEGALRAQMDRFKKKNASTDATALEAALRQRLAKEESAIMGEYYGSVLAIALALLAIFMDTSVPRRRIATIGKCARHLGNTVEYMSCVLVDLGPSLGEGSPLRQAVKPYKGSSDELVRVVRDIIADVLKERPHFEHKIEEARRLNGAAGSSVKNRVFAGFKPDASFTKDVNSQDVITASKRVGVIRRNKMLLIQDRSKDGLVVPALRPIMHKMPLMIVRQDTRSAGDDIGTFAKGDPLLAKDAMLVSLTTENEDMWNELSMQVSLDWTRLFEQLNMTATDSAHSKLAVLPYDSPAAARSLCNCVRVKIPAMLSKEGVLPEGTLRGITQVTPIANPLRRMLWHSAVLLRLLEHCARDSKTTVKQAVETVRDAKDRNVVDPEAIKLEYEKQRETVKQQLMTKMQTFQVEDRSVFRTLKERVGFGNDYLDRIQAAYAEIPVMLPPEVGAEQDDSPDVPMDWAGENPDDIELEDDGSGY